MRRARWLVVFFAVMTTAGVAGFLVTRTSTSVPPPRWPVREATIARPTSYWSREGFVAMEPPVRPPTSEDGREHIVVYLKLPVGGVVRTRLVDSGEGGILEYPIGTAADRVEYWGDGSIDAPPQASWRVADVRGVTLESDGQVFHVYQPTAESRDAPLLGILWPTGDDAVQEDATRALLALVHDGRTLSPHAAPSREQFGRYLRSLNGCTTCHRPGRRGRKSTSEAGLINRGTDGSGFFQVSTVFSDRAPLETYRLNNANASDPFLHFACGEGDTPASLAREAFGRATCPGGEVPVGVLDVRAALRAADPHVLRVCASRRFLYDHLDPDGKRLHAPAIAECDLPQ